MQEEIYPCKSSLTKASLAQGTNVLMTPPHPPLYSILLFPECHDFFSRKHMVVYLYCGVNQEYLHV